MEEESPMTVDPWEVEDRYDAFRYARGERGSIGAYGTIQSPMTVRDFVATLTPAEVKAWHDDMRNFAYLSPGFAVAASFIRMAAESLGVEVALAA